MTGGQPQQGRKQGRNRQTSPRKRDTTKIQISRPVVAVREYSRIRSTRKEKEPAISEPHKFI